jgi:hypothetical protein
MKAQRRHELQHNVLDAELAKGVQFVRGHRTLLGWAGAVAVIAVAVLFYMLHHSSQKRLEVQAQYERLTMDPEITEQEQADGLKTLSQASDKYYAALALARLGDLYARQLVGAALMPPAQQNEFAETAAGYYRRVIDNYPDQKQAVAEAHLGMGKLQESRGDAAAARTEYQSVLVMRETAGWPVGVQAQLAMQGLESYKGPVRMATTTSASAPASAPATLPAEPRRSATQPVGAKAKATTRPGAKP